VDEEGDPSSSPRSVRDLPACTKMKKQPWPKLF